MGECDGGNLPPAGWSTTRDMFLCRAYHEDRWTIGYIWIGWEYGNGIVCFIFGESGLKSYLEYQILSSPEGSTSWVASTDHNLVPNTVIGGTHSSGETAYVCRATALDRRSINLGAYSHEFGLCYFPDDGHLYSNSTFELLVVNAYGRAKYGY